jgi:hypothetical protein
MRFALIMLLAILLPTSRVALAQVPELISFQGYATDSAGVAINNPSASIAFTLYRSSLPAWSETHPNVAIVNGVFGVALGSVVPLDTVDFSTPLDIGINVNGAGELSPRTPLTAAPYALGLRGLDSLVARLTELERLAEGPAVLGASTAQSTGAFQYDSKTGIEAAYAACQDAYPGEPTAHICSYDEVVRALSRGAIGDTASYDGVRTWSLNVGSDHGGTYNPWTTLVKDNCHTLLHNSGDLGVGTTQIVRFGYNPGGNISVTGTHIDLDGIRACNATLPVLCCR